MVSISAIPYNYELPAHGGLALRIIGMQRDFLEAGGFGEALGNDVTRLRAIVPTVKQLLEAFAADSSQFSTQLKGINPTYRIVHYPSCIGGEVS